MTDLKLVSVNGNVSHVPVGFVGTCQAVDAHERLGRLGEGTYGVVYRARGPKGVIALKRMRADREADGMPLATIREVSLLTKIAHQKKQDNIVQVKGVSVGPALDAMFLEMEYCEHDLARLMDHNKEPWTPPQGKFI
jgi:cyclin-dependent kinase 10